MRSFVDVKYFYYAKACYSGGSLFTRAETIWRKTSNITWFFSLPWSRKIFGPTIKGKEVQIPGTTAGMRRMQVVFCPNMVYQPCLHLRTRTERERGDFTVQSLQILCSTATKRLSAMQVGAWNGLCFLSLDDRWAQTKNYSFQNMLEMQQKEGSGWDLQFVMWMSFRGTS